MVVRDVQRWDVGSRLCKLEMGGRVSEGEVTESLRFVA